MALQCDACGSEKPARDGENFSHWHTADETTQCQNDEALARALAADEEDLSSPTHYGDELMSPGSSTRSSQDLDPWAVAELEWEQVEAAKAPSSQRK